ncbi:MAG: U32 family peptidase [Clostridia bacterium]|nr:U32 family peptidase [Clostridia bacterium]
MPENKETPRELLAPAGSMESLRAALCGGADAVYLGAAAFGARQTAGFDPDTLREAVRLAHLHRRRIYVTVNILAKEGELNAVRDTLSLLRELRADAVLVQDLGILKICREEYPELPVHASTQMALHNAAGARLVQSLGASRAVMARECSLAEIRLAAETGIEIEAFCHGALCVSCSGQCLFSSMIGGRSGNRGRCAQPCRLPYAYQGRPGAWLSPRDLCARDELDKMAAAGVYSFKIEGRLKRPEYVYTVTNAYRRALDALAEGRFSPADAAEKEALTQIFSRGGFTRGYPGNAQDAGIIFPDRAAPEGVVIGTAGKPYRRGGALLCDARLTRTLHDGDGLEIGDQALRYSGKEVPAGQTAVLRLREAVRPGEALRRTEDERQLASARAAWEGGKLDAALPIPFSAVLAAFPGKPAVLAVSDGESAAEAEGEICQEAQSRPLDEASARRSLEKTGGTPFTLARLTVRTAGAFLPAAALNALRRDALEQLREKRIAAHPRPAPAPGRYPAEPLPPPAPRLIVKTDDLSDAPRLIAAGADEILWQPRDYAEFLENPRPLPPKTRLCLPPQCGQAVMEKLKEIADRFGIPACLSSPGQLGLFRGMAGEGIPVMNGEAIKMLRHLGCESVTLSRELAKSEIFSLPRDVCELILPVYGRTRLMLLNHCPMRTALGLTRGREKCDLCARGRGARGTCLTDRMGAEYPLSPLHLPSGCVIELLADRPLNLSGLLDGLPPLSFLITFSDETEKERAAVAAHFSALLRGERPGPLPGRFTPGRFRDGVL